MSKVISSLWIVFPSEGQFVNLMCVTPAQLSELKEIWGEIPPMLYGAREDNGETVEQFIAMMFYEDVSEIEEAAQIAYAEIVGELNKLTPAERFIGSLEGGEHDIMSILGIGKD